METVRSSLPGEVTYGMCDLRLWRLCGEQAGGPEAPACALTPGLRHLSPSHVATSCGAHLWTGAALGTTGSLEKLRSEISVRSKIGLRRRVYGADPMRPTVGEAETCVAWGPRRAPWGGGGERQ